ncbi:Myotubularin-related protein 10-A [Eumeta japonica]|uniref:Myotubularin-related protein 10-A n=1 Tax=Eumeta variegata TaxID=151549 RepID=A0A4C1X326_EUMVA|nr:Myotubularin-related protein 10-A [Eumeta japonica]
MSGSDSMVKSVVFESAGTGIDPKRSFANSSIDQGRLITMALVHHAFPKRHHLLFAYDYREPYYPTLPADMNMFLRPADWKKELERCECPHWRITCINGTSDGFMPTAGETLIVPSSMLDYSLIDTARLYRAGRVPVWVWGRPDGAALLRSGETLQTEASMTAESIFLEQVRRSHPKLRQPRILYLCGGQAGYADAVTAPLPALAALHASYNKLLDLCTPTTLRGFWEQDSQYYSILDSSKWLRHVAGCLALADEAAASLDANDTVVLVEGEGVDYCAVVSCLTQLLLDPHCRTISGFQSLIQKEWVALGHPFCDRLGLLTPTNPKDQANNTERAPVFLLFLDCVWQLQNQFPTEFQFSETYLTTLWDCCHNQLFDTFIFNCPRDRELAVSKFLYFKKRHYGFHRDFTARDLTLLTHLTTQSVENEGEALGNFVLRPVWDWGEQFSEQDMSMFYNPLYAGGKLQPLSQRMSRSSITSMESRLERLRPCAAPPAVELWSQCYERWLLPLDAAGAGRVQYHIYNVAVLDQIHRLKEKMVSLSIMSRHSTGEAEAGALKRHLVPRFYPFSCSRAQDAPTTLDAMQVSLIDASQLLDSQSLLNAPD